MNRTLLWAHPSLNLDEKLPNCEKQDAVHESIDLTALVKGHLNFVWKLLRRLGLSEARADDVTQEVFVVAVRRKHELVVGRERSFLYAVAVRLAANARRQLRRQREAPLDDTEHGQASHAGPEEALEQRRRIALLDALLAELPERFRRVLVLSDVFELDVREVAALERIPTGTVASRLRRARELLRNKAKRWTAPGGSKP